MEMSSRSASQILTEKFFTLYPGEVASHLDELPVDDILGILQSMPISASAKVFLRLNPDKSASLIEQMDDDFFCNIYVNIDLVQGATLLARLDKKALKNRLELLPEKLAKEYQELISYPPDCAGYMMDPRVLTFTPHDTVEKVLGRVRAVTERRIIDICVVDEEGVIVGVVPLQDIAVSQPTQPLGELILREPVTVNMMDPR